MQLNFVIFLGVLVTCAQCKILKLSCKDIGTFVTGHNIRRLSLARGEVPRQPAAADMTFMVWDNELAAKAENWALKYRKYHNPDKTIRSKRFITGENLYWYSTTDPNEKFAISQALKEWFDMEHKQYLFGPFKRRVGDAPKIGHYTQMAWSKTTHVGCAVSTFKDGKWTRYFTVCNYGPAGNVIGSPPYQPTEKSSARKLICPTGSDCTHPFGNKC